MAYITYAQRREWNDFYREHLLPALRDGSLDDLLQELNTEVRARRDILRNRLLDSQRQAQRRQQTKKTKHLIKV